MQLTFSPFGALPFFMAFLLFRGLSHKNAWTNLPATYFLWMSISSAANFLILRFAAPFYAIGCRFFELSNGFYETLCS